MMNDIPMDVVYHLICQGPSAGRSERTSALRKSNKEAAQTREAIVTAAADYIRRTGITEASLADVMAAAGLTHGGFYRHFRNKEHLIAEALSAAGVKTITTIDRNLAKGGINAVVEAYLSAAHRDSPTPICPFASLGSDIARSGNETKSAAIEVLEKLFAILAANEAGADRRGDAIATFSTMMGAMILARIASGTPLSAEILEHAKTHLREEIGGARKRYARKH
jgi:TetR/AcrR family transcriptional regulator, transcriptional repressor for nem operon